MTSRIVTCPGSSSKQKRVSDPCEDVFLKNPLFRDKSRISNRDKSRLSNRDKSRLEVQEEDRLRSFRRLLSTNPLFRDKSRISNREQSRLEFQKTRQSQILQATGYKTSCVS